MLDSILARKNGPKFNARKKPQHWEAKSYGLRMTTAMVTIGLVYVAWRGDFLTEKKTAQRWLVLHV